MRKNYGMELLWMMPKKGNYEKKKVTEYYWKQKN